MAHVIRSRPDDERLQGAEVWDARRQAELVLQRGRSRAREVVEAALAEAEAIRTAAREEGARRGRAEAARELLVAATEHRAALEAARRDIVRVGLAVAHRIVGEEVRLSPDRIEAIVRGAIEAAPGARALSLRVHPEDVEHARRAVEGAAPPGRLTVLPSPELARGDCVLETDRGTVDARIEVQLALLEERLLGG